MRKLFFVLFALSALTVSTVFVSCREADVESVKQNVKTRQPKCDVLTIEIIPYDDFKPGEANRLAHEVYEHLQTMIGERRLRVKVMPNEELPAKFRVRYHNKKGYRFRADSIIHSLERRREPNVIKLGVTNDDVSTTVHGFNDFGICGLSSVPGHSAVISTVRANGKVFWKVAVHEILHSIGLRHCPKNDTKCLMKDAKGHPRFEEKEGLCATCDSVLREKVKSYK